MLSLIGQHLNCGLEKKWFVNSLCLYLLRCEIHVVHRTMSLRLKYSQCFMNVDKLGSSKGTEALEDVKPHKEEYVNRLHGPGGRILVLKI